MSRSPDWRPGRITVGRVGRPHGLDGSLHLTGHGGVVPLRPGTAVEVGGRPSTILACKGTAERPLVRLDLAATREEAEALRGLEVTVDAELLPEAGQDEYFHVDLIGCEVVEAGVRLGEVTDVLEYPANDLLEVRGEEGTRLVPFVDDVVERVDVAARRIELRPGVL
jgi:16S rRNA processing protein RimM